MSKSGACIDNQLTGERYEYINDRFIPTALKNLSQDETMILRCLAKGFKMKDIGEELNMKQRTVELKAKSAFDKLGVSTQGAATYKAKELGLI